jgi:predicted nucleotidyltransferase
VLVLSAYFSKYFIIEVDKKIEIQVINFLVKKIPELLGIYIFGSYVGNTMTTESDIDIAFLSFQKISPVDKWKIQENLASKLGRNVDLVDLKDASVVLRSEIIENGIRIFTGNAYECDNFEVTTYSMYADLNESRIHILNDFKEKYGRNPIK